MNQENISLIDEASDRDRAYFEGHPERSWYVRERMPGEFDDPAARLATHIYVTQIAPGIRTREPMVLLRARDYAGGRVPKEHVEALAALTGNAVADAFVVRDSDLDE